MPYKFYLSLLLALNLLLSCSEPAHDDNVMVIPDMQISTELSNQRVQAITQDSSGYIWIATYRGLNRFDGNEMHQYYYNGTPTSLPDNQIWDILCDSKKQLWVATKAGIARYTDQDNFKSIPTDKGDIIHKLFETTNGDIFALHPTSLLRLDAQADSFVTVLPQLPTSSHFMRLDCHPDPYNRIWLIDEHGAWAYDAQTMQLKDTVNFGTLNVIHSHLYGDNLWLASDNRVLLYDIRLRVWHDDEKANDRVQLKESTIECIRQVTDQHLLIGTTKGMLDYDMKEQKLMYEKDPDFIVEAPPFTVSKIYFDRERRLWFGSSTQGFKVSSPTHRQFNTDKTLNQTFAGKSVMAVRSDGKDNIWVAVGADIIYRYNNTTHEVDSFDLTECFHGSQLVSNISINDICIGPDNDLWVIDSNSGVFHVSIQGNQLKAIEAYSCLLPINLNFGQHGVLWIGCYHNLFYSKHPNEQMLREHRLFSNTFTYLSCIHTLSDGSCATLSKDVAIRMIDTTRMELGPQVIPDSALSRCLHNGTFLPTDMLEDRQGNLWIGTISNGLLHYDRQKGLLTNIPGSPCEDICSLQEDTDGDIWVSTKFGLGQYDVASKTFINYYRSDGIGGNEFIDRSSCRLPNGVLLFGGNHGITLVHEQRHEPKKPSLYLLDLTVNNELIRPGKDQPITESLTHAKEICLDYHQQSFTISFGALDYAEEERYEYQYKLEGFNKEWVDVNHGREAYFANLDPGHYTFKVRIKNREQGLQTAECSIPVNIYPAPWFSIWARLIYLLVLGTIVFFIWKSWYDTRVERRNRLITEREREHERRINRMNMNFFANVSHEFRAPLTIISGPVSQLVHDPELPERQRELLVIVQRSVNRMLRLVNQMMDFHKLEDDALRLEVQRLDVIQILRHAVEPFQLQAGEKKQTLTLYGLEDICLQWIDADKLEKIVYNLLGNATKYTPAGGRIDFSFDIVGNNMKIVVSDNGEGIPSEQRERIFDRYYQLNRQVKGEFNWGTGIGLYYTRKLVQMHHGTIEVTARPDGNGAVFTVLLPTDESVYSESERTNATASQGSLYPIAEQSEPQIVRSNPQDNVSDQDRLTLLLIDDDVEIVHYLKTLLSPQYNVICRFDAESALLVIHENAPDLIVSDVMMTGMDGIEFCRQVKSDLQLCHIPVILLTAKTTTSDQITGLNAGADAYVAKPFDPSYLKALIANILQNREKVRHLLADSTQTVALSENDLSPQDNAFMTDLYALMEKELPNPDLDINLITEMLHISRTKFYYKMKGLTGEKPSAFFKRYKLNRAAELIREGRYNISEISDMTGYNSLSHFSASFKRQFGVPPTEFK